MAAANATSAPPSSSQCEYESWNATTNCWNYRTCTNCLLTPVLSQGCMIGQSGVCQSLDRATPQHNYTRAFSLNLTLPGAKDMNLTMKRVTQEWEFPAKSVFYCELNDAICQQCIQEKFWMNGMFDSRFCVGVSGCVCISACEFATHNPSCELPNQPSVNVPTTTKLPTYEQCHYSFQDPISKCYKLRSCSSCLKIPGCRVGLGGTCEPNSNEYIDHPEEFDYRRAFEFHLALPEAQSTNSSGLSKYQSWHFPASNLTYCPTDDTVCKQCTEENYWLGPDRTRDSRFCVGKDGCICIANCARDDNATLCPSPSPPITYDEEPSWATFEIFMIVVLVVGILSVVGCFWCLCRWCGKRRLKHDEEVQVARIVSEEEAAAQDHTATPMYVIVRPE